MIKLMDIKIDNVFYEANIDSLFFASLKKVNKYNNFVNNT